LNRVTERLSSLNFATWTLVILFLWIVWGLALALNDDFFNGFREMNSVLVRDWLLDPTLGLIHLKVWFVGLCLVMVVMGVNLVFCSWNRILKIMRHHFSGAKLFMLIVHIIFGLVALGHLGGFMLGYRYDVLLENNNGFQFEGDYELKVTDIHFANDPEILKKSRREMLRNEFQYENNFAEVALYQGEHLLLKDQIYLLSPLHYGDIQITMKRFLPPKENETSEGLPGVMFAISCNPVLKIFLWIYPLMILGIAVHLIMTWRQPDRGNLKEI
jgi:hypothetical protein